MERELDLNVVGSEGFAFYPYLDYHESIDGCHDGSSVDDSCMKNVIVVVAAVGVALVDIQ